ncbi:MAG: SprT family zinc-dependent metalloprotease [bacterium]
MKLGDLRIEVVRKDIKNLHLSVHPPNGRVRIAVPRHVSDDAIRAFTIGKLAWIRQRRTKLQEQEREAPREFIDRETHYVWGRRCLLRVIESDGAPTVDWQAQRLTLHVRPGTDPVQRAAVLESWYRTQLRSATASLIPRWEATLRVGVSRCYVQRMRTRWGSCNPVARSIRLNTDLAKKPRACLEYVLVHEMTHLLQPGHGARFVELMDRFLPGWQHRRTLLNRLPLRHHDWLC